MSYRLRDVLEAMGAPDLPNAACAGTPIPDVFFPDSQRQEADFLPLVKRTCERCVEKIACLTYAIENDVEHGIWGGLTPIERERLAGKPARRLRPVERVQLLLDYGFTVEQACDEVGISVIGYLSSSNRMQKAKSKTQPNT